MQAPLPSASRCYRLGEAIGRAIESWTPRSASSSSERAGSHQLDGTRAGHINKEFDRKFMDSLVDDPKWATQYSTLDLVELWHAGIELLMWLVARGALTGKVDKLHSNYHIPISNTASGLMLLENRD